MAASYYKHSEILEVLSDVEPFNNFLLKFFSREHITDQEEINFDKIDPDNRIALFVNPRVPGKVARTRGSQVRTYKPGYVKDKESVEFTHVFVRRAGEPIAAPLTPEQRYLAILADKSRIMRDRLYRRLEVMASQLLSAGTYTMTGDQISVEVDFARAAGNTITLAGANQWKSANAAVSPFDDLEDWINKAKQPIRTMIIGKHAWRRLKADPKFDKLIYIDVHTKGSIFASVGPQQNDITGVTFRGIMPGTGIEIYTYTETYTHPETGVETLYVADDAVILLPDSRYGIQCFASILDSEANYQGMQYFFKNWEEKDPGIPFVMLQSAPMLAHVKIDSTVYASTGADGT